MFKSINLPRLRSGEFLAFFVAVLKRCMRFDVESLHIKPLTEKLEQCIQQLEASYNNEQGSDLTDELTLLDSKRDRNITGIKLLCEAFTYHPDTEVADAAQEILDNMNRHGSSIAKLDYPTETMAINSIVNDWEKSESLQQAINTLDLAPWATQLKTDNTKFSATFQERIDDKMNNKVTSFSSLRAEAINTYKALTQAIESFAFAYKLPEYQQLADALNLIIEEYQVRITKREASVASETDA